MELELPVAYNNSTEEQSILIPYGDSFALLSHKCTGYAGSESTSKSDSFLLSASRTEEKEGDRQENATLAGNFTNGYNDYSMDGYERTGINSNVGYAPASKLYSLQVCSLSV